MLIALTGFKGSGKTEVLAKHMQKNHGFTGISFATPIKRMLAAIDVPFDCLYGNRKEEPLDTLCGHSTRYALQTLGTEWGRNIIGDNLWINRWKHMVVKANNDIVTDDLRFPNEEAAVRALGGLVVKIYRPGFHGSAHISESGIDLIRPDLLLRNIGTPEELCHDFDEWFKTRPWKTDSHTALHAWRL